MGDNVTIEGAAAVLKVFEELQHLERELREPTEMANELLINRVRLYPSPPSGSEYERTFTLRDSWQALVLLTSEALGIVRSDGVPYNEYVMGPEQAWMHQGRWDTVQDIITDEEAAVLQLFEDFIQGKMNG